MRHIPLDKECITHLLRPNLYIFANGKMVPIIFTYLWGRAWAKYVLSFGSTTSEEDGIFQENSAPDMCAFFSICRVSCDCTPAKVRSNINRFQLRQSISLDRLDLVSCRVGCRTAAR